MKDENVYAVQQTKQANAVADPGNLMLLIYTVIVALVIIGGSLVSADAAEQVKPQPEERGSAEFRFEDIKRGELFLPGVDGNAVPALQMAQKATLTISGIAARVRVSQEFQNTGGDWVDGVYVFPLPDESAVDRLRMIIGEREIVGEIREKEEAKAIYTQAKQEGRKTSLLSQQRPNIFTTRVANIGPGEKITIVIEYQQLVQYDNEIFSVRFPMAMTPRYIPGAPLNMTERRTLSFSGEGWAKDTDQVPDASTITPPVAAPVSGAGPAMDLSVDLESGFALSKLESLYHTMAIEEREVGSYALTFTGEILADRDFVLEWQAEKSEQPAAALLSESQGDDTYMLLMLSPPSERRDITVPREVIFILDVSGSMAGPSIVQAKEALRSALKRLGPADRFNIVSFNNTADALFPASRSGTEQHKNSAFSYLNSLQADGGTEMKAALELALDGGVQSERIRQVIFLTDGAVGNEAALFGLINQRLGDSRLFTVGIGAAPNSYFMSRAATMGRGTYTFIGDINEVQQRMDELLTKIEAPAVTDIMITAADGGELSLESYPNPLPDLYFGKPVQVAMRMQGEPGVVKVSGGQNGKRWEYTIDMTRSKSRPGIAALWARKKIRSQMESLALGADAQSVKESVLKTALSHKLVSRYTSLVAVDRVVSKPENVQSKKEMVPTHAPRGLQMDKVFAGGSRTATPAAMNILVGSLLLLAASVLYRVRRKLRRG